MGLDRRGHFVRQVRVPSPATVARLGAVTEERVAALWPWRDLLPGWTVDWLPGRPGLLGGTWTYQHRVEVYVRDGDEPAGLAFTFAHELGHIVDMTWLTDADRAGWAGRRGITGRWWTSDEQPDWAVGAGDWAETFAAAVTGDQTRYAAWFPPPTMADLAYALDLVAERATQRTNQPEGANQP